MLTNLQKFIIILFTLTCVNSAIAVGIGVQYKQNVCSDNADKISSVIQSKRSKAFGLLTEVYYIGLVITIPQRDFYICTGTQDVANNITWNKISAIRGFAVTHDPTPLLSQSPEGSIKVLNEEYITTNKATVAYIGKNTILVILPDVGTSLLYSMMGKIDDATDNITWGQPTEIANGKYPVVRIVNNLVELEYEKSYLLFGSSIASRTGVINWKLNIIDWGSEVEM